MTTPRHPFMHFKEIADCAYLCYLWLIIFAVLTSSCSRLSIKTETLVPSATNPSPPSLSTGTSAPAAAVHWPSPDWTLADPSAHGLDPARLDALVAATPQRNPAATSILVVSGGDLVLERYFGSGSPETPHEIYSATKSFISTLVGIAVDQGLLNLDQHIVDSFPGRRIAERSAAKDAVTVEDLLTMTSGLEWEESDASIGQLYTSRNWVQFMLDKPVVEPPGSRFNYCTGCSHLLSALLEQASGENTYDFANRVLFEPLGIQDPYWLKDPQGLPVGGWGLQLTPRDLARLGYLYLRQGEWKGLQVVSPGWVQAATTAHMHAEDGLDYGYQWWVRPSIHGYAAIGRGGQMVAVIPEKDLVVVFTSSEGGSEPLFKLIEDFIFP